MSTLLILFAIAVGLFLSALVVLILGALKKRRKSIVIGVIIAFLSISVGTYAGYQLLRKTYDKVTKTLAPRSGKEIYVALFGEPASCVEVIHSQDQVVPKIDYAIWLWFKTCPEEVDRVLAQQKYEAKFESTITWHMTGPLANDKWFKPQNLGDSVWVYKYEKDEYGNVQTLYINKEKTEGYCEDILD